jgi:hypothetical protein
MPCFFIDMWAVSVFISIPEIPLASTFESRPEVLTSESPLHCNLNKTAKSKFSYAPFKGPYVGNATRSALRRLVGACHILTLLL